MSFKSLFKRHFTRSNYCQGHYGVHYYDNAILFRTVQLYRPGPRFNMNILSYQYRKSYCGDETVVRSSYLHNGISYIGKMTSLYWIRAQASIWHRYMSNVVFLRHITCITFCRIYSVLMLNVTVLFSLLILLLVAYFTVIFITTIGIFYVYGFPFELWIEAFRG